MKSLQGRLIVAFAAVSLVSIGAVAVLAGAAARAEFDRYFFAAPAPGGPPAPQDVPPRPVPPAAMPHMRGPAGEVMMRRMGVAEFRFLGALRRATWAAALTGVLAAVLLGVLVARRVTAPLRALSEAAGRVGRGDLSPRVPVPDDEDLGGLARAFNTMTADLSRLEESRRHLAADIAHELGTPLAVLQANLEGMLDGVVETTPERLAALHTQVRLLSRLVDDLRDLSLAQAGRLVLDRQPADLAAMVQDVLAALLPYAGERRVALRTEVAAGLPQARLDRDRMLQVIHNLLDNAIRHTPAGGEVTVGLAPAADGLRLWVRDDGPGIPPEEVERVFDRFYRLDASRTRASGGTGLGLAIVRALVEAHGGRVWVESRPKAGSTFVVSLPR